MDCMNPMLAVWSGDKYRFVGAVNGSSAANRKYLYDTTGKFVVIPCGQCYACRLAKSREWAARCVLEAKSHDSNCFITLTYDDNHVPADMSLQKKDFTNFIKRLRKNTGEKIRYYACGEYGELHQRPHFHACLFGYKPKDLVLWSVRQGVSLYRSAEIEKAWQFQGYCTVGDVSYESAAYVARYVLKKVTGVNAESHYNGRQPEYTVMSRKPGIAADFFNKYNGDIYGKDFIVIRDGIKLKPPRYFDRLFDVYYGDDALEEFVKPERLAKGVRNFNRHLDEYSFSRIVARARVRELKGRKLKRSLEEMI